MKSSRTKTFATCGPNGDVGTEGKKSQLFFTCEVILPTLNRLPGSIEMAFDGGRCITNGCYGLLRWGSNGKGGTNGAQKVHEWCKSGDVFTSR